MVKNNNISEQTVVYKRFSDQEALEFHSSGRPGKLEIIPTKPMSTQRDLSLAYSPGVAVPVKAIAENETRSFDYTSRGNLVAVVSNGTAILGLGNLGAVASKPVMEGKAVLFKRFADVDSIDLELDTEDVEEFIGAVRYLGPTFGGINLEDIKAPECFIIEERLRELMNIPVFHDDQHGTAIICLAGLINALDIAGKKLEEVQVVVNGAGAAGVACLNLIKQLGLPDKQALLLDSKGVIYRGREKPINQWQARHAVTTDRRTLEDALKGADVFLGLSKSNLLSEDMLKSMAKNPIIFAMANPDPEVKPEYARSIRPDAIIATGRSDYPNQVNNVLGFPYIFRGALDVRASTINEEMKIAAAQALAQLAREDVPDDVAKAYGGRRLRFGRDYIIPVPFDPRLISVIPPAVARAAMESGVAQKPIVDLERYSTDLMSRQDPVSGFLQRVFERVRRKPKRIVFAEGEESQSIRAARTYVNQGFGSVILLGREEQVRETAALNGVDISDGIEIINARMSSRTTAYTDYLFKRLQRRGYLQRDCQRMINNDRNHFGAAMVALGDADAMVTGLTRNYSIALEEVRRVIDDEPGKVVIGVSLIISRGRVLFVADTAIHELPDPRTLAKIATTAAGVARRMGYEPRVAMLAGSNFGHPPGQVSDTVREAVNELDRMGVDFEYEGEMTVDVALEASLRGLYPFNRLSDTANVLIMPAIHSASISTKLLNILHGAMVIGPILVGLSNSVQIMPLNAKDTEIVNMAALAAYDVSL